MRSILNLIESVSEDFPSYSYPDDKNENIQQETSKTMNGLTLMTRMKILTKKPLTLWMDSPR